MTVKEVMRVHIPTKTKVRSLVWDGDELVDWVGGGIRFTLDGTASQANAIYYPDRFDRAAILPGTDYAVLYEVLGTKGLILKAGEQVREINRSDYHADRYEYPIAIFSLPDGTGALAHCPNEYNELQIEEIKSGRCLTTRTSKAIDFFHSRLQVSPDGKHLVSAGWVWHPFDSIQLFQLAEVLQEPEMLDQYCSPDLGNNETHSVAFDTSGSLLYATESGPEEAAPCVGKFDLATKQVICSTQVESTPGTLMPVGNEHVIGFFESPKLYELRSGKVVLTWPDLKTGRQNSSILRDDDAVPPLAIDIVGLRFAVAADTQISVIQIGVN